MMIEKHNKKNEENKTPAEDEGPPSKLSSARKKKSKHPIFTIRLDRKKMN